MKPRSWKTDLPIAWEWIALAIIIGVYLLTQVSLLSLPGMQQDEAVSLTPSLELAHGRPITYGASISVLGLHYPTMLGAYTGALLTVPTAAIFRLFGFHLELARFIWVLAGAGTLLFTFLLCRQLFSSGMAVLAAMFLSVNPSFWMFSHVGSYTSAHLTLDITASLFFFLIFYRARRDLYLFLAMFFFGHGIFTKIAFGYFMFAYAASFAVLWLGRKIDRRVLSLRNLAISALGFFFGSWPLLYNLATSADTATSIAAAISGTSASGTSNLMIWQNLLTRLGQTRDFLLQGSAPVDAMLPVPAAHNLLMPYVFVACILALLALILLPGRRAFPREKLAFFLFVFAVFQFLIIFAPSTFNSSVYAFIPPVLAIVVTLALHTLHAQLRSGGRAAGSLAVIALGVVVFASEAYVLASQYNAVRMSGGTGIWSRSVFQLSDYLLQQPDRQPVALDWGLDQPVYVLTDLRVRPISAYVPYTRVAATGWLQLWDKTPPPEYLESMQTFIQEPGNLYIARPEGWAQFKGRRAALDQLVRQGGGELAKTKTIYDDQGGVWAEIYEVRR